MSTSAELLHDLRETIFERIRVRPEVVRALPENQLKGDGFAEEQLRGLVRRIFFPGWPRSSRQVVFAAVDENGKSGEVCRRVAHALELQMPGTICVVETDSGPSQLNDFFGGTSVGSSCAHDRFDELRKSSRQISDHLWFISREQFMKGDRTELSAAWLRGRLGQLRLDFDFTILHAPPAGRSTEAALLGHLCDGIILVLEANRTRRLAAQQCRTALQTANARLLGTVLSDRKFPIPDRLYRRL